MWLEEGPIQPASAQFELAFETKVSLKSAVEGGADGQRIFDNQPGPRV